MIQVKFCREDNRFSFSCTGHAGYGKKGQDIVCASATILAYTLAQNIQDREKDGIFVSKPILTLKPGKATIQVLAKEENKETVRVIFSVIGKGFACLAANYPNCVKFQNF